MKEIRPIQLEFPINLGPRILTYENVTRIENISGDTVGPFVLEALYTDDVYLTMLDTKDYRQIPPDGMRFRTSGSDFLSIALELSVLPKIFRNNNGHIPQSYKGFSNGDSIGDYFPGNGMAVETHKNKALPKIEVKNIPCDDEGQSKQMDIVVLHSGDVVLKMRGHWIDEEIIQGEMVFKTAENGGKFPIMAFVFTKIAERIVKAKQKEITLQR